MDIDLLSHRGRDADMFSSPKWNPSAEHELEFVETPPVLFRLKKQRKRELWQFVRLAAKDEYHHLRPDQLKSEHAESAYCMRCKCRIYFQTGQNGVKQHMEKYHGQIMHGFGEKPKGDRNGDAASDVVYPNGRFPNRPLFEVSEKDQQRANEFLARWMVQSLHSISMVEDDGFRMYIEFIARELAGINLKIPKRTQVRSDMVRVAAEQRAARKTKIDADCAFYAVTTDIWTDRRLRNYVSLTAHYLDKQFLSNNWTLEVKRFPGKHTGTSIASALDDTLSRWELKKSFCTKLLRDGAANAVLASNILGVGHMSCIAHSIHLVVAEALIEKKRSSA